MSVSPEYGDEERLRNQVDQLRERSEGLQPDDRRDGPELEVAEQGQQEREAFFLDAESNEAHAPAGQICERCGQVIASDDNARMRADGGWVHEVCPTQG